MRQKIHSSNAARQRAYRLRNGIKSKPDIHRLNEWLKINKRDKAKTASRLREYNKRKRMQIPFVAFDGEGINTKQIAYQDDKKVVYKQIYTLLSASDGQYIEDWKNGLSTNRCLDFLLAYSGDSYLVGFGIGYDVTKILVDIGEFFLKILWEKQEVVWNDYHIKYIPNKIFIVKKGDRSITLYDVFGFFQKSFIKSLADWKIDCPKEIIEGKEQRGEFQAKNKAKIRKYNLIECQLLVELMNKLRNAMFEADFLPNQWYGAGAIASYILEANGIKYVNGTSENMIPYFLNAYYGGRNQVLQMGEFDKVWLHDINSAYPAAMLDLPVSLGKWYEAEPEHYPEQPNCLYEVEWKLPKDTIITPFPVRTKDKSIHWPQTGRGWYWYPEVDVAMWHYHKYIKIHRCFYFEAINNDKPFQFVKDYYDRRKAFIASDNDAQLVLKLGINAIYGKLAQSIGKQGSKPPYQNFFWSGLITSHTRASVFSLAMYNPGSIITFSTDGIASNKQLCSHSQEKNLGEWEVKEIENYFVLQSGVYDYTHNSERRFKSRGFSHRNVDYDELRRIWRKDGISGIYEYKENRLVSIGNGLRQDYALIGNWYEQEREIVFKPTSMDFDLPRFKYKQLRLRPPRNCGESLAYQMKVNWLNQESDFQEVENDLHIAM